ncbi:uncharacterized protein EI90DRAFT_3033536 [Cantharellus anzutake]|uniref:uncharacterized protein n=1 Tax=Cantharellus anzutake TaxID=1750568 RepID=UPI0019066C18|nr:uncharacterized protein EI90DRAFT_3033536 [Cantharellus anzutake]KAF8341331.1 hypothetical protein EI90DRAFT_3033536 [Cantharellus anzutake]
MISRRSSRTPKKSAKVAAQLEPESEDDSPSPIQPSSSSKAKGKKAAPAPSKGKQSLPKRTSGGTAVVHNSYNDERDSGSQNGNDSFEAPNDPSAELGLAALRDSPEGMKPFYPYSTLIRYAIKGSPERKMLLEDIYAAIEERFPWFKTAPTGWKNSIRHNLSLNPSFQKVPRPLTDRGKGAYWTVNDNVDPRSGSHRSRKKRARESPLDGTVPFPEGASNIPYGRVVYPSFTFDPNAQIQIRFPTTGENIELALCPEVDEEGSPNWRSIWLNELIKLQHATAEAERNGQDADWYRAMIERLRVAFAPQIDDEEDEEQVRQAMQADEKGSDADGDGEREPE